MRFLPSAITIAFLCVWPSFAAPARDEPPDATLDRLRAEEDEREGARAAAAAKEAAERERREREREEKRRQEALAERQAAAAFALRRAAMHDWHRDTFALLGPVLAAREQLYRGLPHRRFAAVRPACVAFRAAIADASPAYRKAPDRRVDLLATDLFAIYRESARWCTEGGYFSFTAKEAEVRRVVGELIDALAPYDLGFPVSAPVGPRAPLAAPESD